MNALLIRNVQAVDPGHRVFPADILVRDGLIETVAAAGSLRASGADEVEGAGRLLTPGLIDVHTHGILKVVYESGPRALAEAAAALGRFGVTTVVPTLVPRDLGPGARERFLADLRALAEAIPSVRGVHIPGLHLEGPFMAVAGAACATLDGNLPLLEEIVDACRNRLAVMSVSPETRGILPVIRRLRELGVAVFFTHTRAGPEATAAAIDAGATHATHFYDVFYAPTETDPGVRPVGAVEAALADPRATVDFIADGIHVHPMAIRAALAAKSWRGVSLITDSNIGAGLPDGLYDTPWGYRVRVSPDTAARHAVNGTLAGSALTMNRGIANLLRWLDLPPEQVWAMGTLNPAHLLGLERKGRIQPGADADLVLWRDDLNPAFTWLAGQLTHEDSSF